MSNLVRNYHSGIKLIRPSQLHNNYLDSNQMPAAPVYETPDLSAISLRAMTDQKIISIRRDQLKTFHNHIPLN